MSTREGSPHSPAPAPNSERGSQTHDDQTSLQNIILVGFMGTGKTTTGRIVAAQLGWRFADTDHVIERRAGKSVRALFETEGEAVFRKLEADLCAELASWQRTVLATGGGILLDSDNRARLKAAGLVVCLTASVEQIASRLEADKDRPLLKGEDRVQRLSDLLDTRREVYDGVPHRIETDGLTPHAVSEKVIALWRSAH